MAAKLKPAAQTGTPSDAIPQETDAGDTAVATAQPASLFGVDGTTGQPESSTATPSKSPTLVWTEPRRLALVTAYVAGNHTTASIARALASDPAFANYPGDQITPDKVRSQILKLRKAAEKEGATFALPPLDREPGVGGRPFGSVKPINWEALNAVLQGAESGSGASEGASNVA